jgi:hypothetical protein
MQMVRRRSLLSPSSVSDGRRFAVQSYRHWNLLRLDIVVPDVAAGEQSLKVTIGGESANTSVLSVQAVTPHENLLSVSFQ